MNTPPSDADYMKDNQKPDDSYRSLERATLQGLVQLLDHKIRQLAYTEWLLDQAILENNDLRKQIKALGN